MINLTDRMERVFQEVFENDELRLSDGMSQSTLPAWDSFAQVKLVIGLEEEFGVKFKPGDYIEDFQKKVAEFKPDLIGVTVVEDTWPQAKRLIRLRQTTRPTTRALSEQLASILGNR